MASRQLKYPPEFKAEVCEYAKKESIVYASILYSLHRNTIANWVKKYKKSGIKGFTIVRKDTQKAKLDKALLDKIVRYKRRNPKATLKMIREKFGIGCHITLIGRKLKKVYQPVKRKKQKETLFLQTKIIRDAGYKDSAHPVFRLSLHLCCGKPLSIGFTSWYSSEKICLFIRYSLEKLKDLKTKRIFKKIVTSTKFIKKDDFATLVSNYHDIELQIVKAGEYKVCSDDGINFSEKGLKHSMIESYDKILEDFDSHELNNVLLTSLVNINELSKNDIAVKSWDSLFMPSETKKSFYNALEKIKEKGDKAVLEFDYDTAKNEYHKAYSGMTALKIDDKEMYLSILSEKAKLYYNIEQYQTALMLYRDISRATRSEDRKNFRGDAYYHIALIFISFQNVVGAVNYFRLSARSFESNSDLICKCKFFRAKYREYLTQGNYEEAEKYSEIYYENALKTRDKEIIGNCLSIKGAYLYRPDKIKEFEKLLLEAKEYNIKHRNLYDACKNLTNLLSIYSYYILKEETQVNEILKDLKMITDEIKMPNLIYEAMYRLGVFYYNKSRESEALTLFTKALPGVKKHMDKETYLSTLYYVGRLNFLEEDYKKAIKYMNVLAKNAEINNNKLYLMHSYRYLTKIYFEAKKFSKAVFFVRKVVLIATKNKEFYICGEFHSYYGDISNEKKMKNKALYHYKQAMFYYKLLQVSGKYDLKSEIAEIKMKIQCSK